MMWILDYTEDYMERYPKTENFGDRVYSYKFHC